MTYRGGLKVVKPQRVKKQERDKICFFEFRLFQLTQTHPSKREAEIFQLLKASEDRGRKAYALQQHRKHNAGELAYELACKYSPQKLVRTTIRASGRAAQASVRFAECEFATTY